MRYVDIDIHSQKVCLLILDLVQDLRSFSIPRLYPPNHPKGGLCSSIYTVAISTDLSCFTILDGGSGVVDRFAKFEYDHTSITCMARRFNVSGPDLLRFKLMSRSRAYSGTKIENGTLQNGASYISPVNPTYTTTVTVPSDAPSNATSNATGSDDHLHLADFILRLVNLMLTLGRTSWKNWSKSWYTGEENT